MAMPQLIGRDPVFDREVWLLSVDSMDSPFDRPSSLKGQFTCLCASDARNVPAELLAKFCSRLIKMGCAYLCAWGPACERVHDAMDEQIMGDQPPETNVGCLMTTWHAKDSLDKAIWYFLNCTEPDEEYAPNGCDVALIISVGHSDWSAAIDERVRASFAEG